MAASLHLLHQLILLSRLSCSQSGVRWRLQRIYSSFAVKVFVANILREPYLKKWCAKPLNEWQPCKCLMASVWRRSCHLRGTWLPPLTWWLRQQQRFPDCNWLVLHISFKNMKQKVACVFCLTPLHRLICLHNYWTLYCAHISSAPNTYFAIFFIFKQGLWLCIMGIQYTCYIAMGVK